MARNAPVLIKAEDQPEEMPEAAEAVMESDKLFFLDPKNKGKIMFQRGLAEGEELPYKMPADATVVQVLKTERRFFVTGQHMLTIRYPERPTFNPKKKREHKVVVVSLNQQRRAKARKAKEADQPKPVELTLKEQGDRTAAEWKRQADRRIQKEARRNIIRAEIRMGRKLNVRPEVAESLERQLSRDLPFMKRITGLDEERSIMRKVMSGELPVDALKHWPIQ